MFTLIVETTGLDVQGRTAVFADLSRGRPTCKLLYATPEQLTHSQALQDILLRLHDRCGVHTIEQHFDRQNHHAVVQFLLSSRMI